MTLLILVGLAIWASLLCWAISALKQARAKRLELELMVHRVERERDALMQRINAMHARDELRLAQRPGQQELDAAMERARVRSREFPADRPVIDGQIESARASTGVKTGVQKRQERHQGAIVPVVIPMPYEDTATLPPPVYGAGGSFGGAGASGSWSDSASTSDSSDKS